MSVLMGPNGAGKSTLLKSIFNLVKLTGGKITYRGDDITALPTHNLIELGIAYVPQGKVNFGSLTVRENLLMGEYHLENAAARETNLEKVLAAFPQLKDRLSSRAYVLSGGQQQMVAMARALMNSPDLLLLDEPSLGLAPKAVAHLFAIIRQISADGLPILLVEQNAYQALQIAHRAYVLETGRIVLSDTAANLARNPQVKAAYLGG